MPVLDVSEVEDYFASIADGQHSAAGCTASPSRKAHLSVNPGNNGNEGLHSLHYHMASCQDSNTEYLEPYGPLAADFSTNPETIAAGKAWMKDQLVIAAYAFIQTFPPWRLQCVRTFTHDDDVLNFFVQLLCPSLALSLSANQIKDIVSRAAPLLCGLSLRKRHWDYVRSECTARQVPAGDLSRYRVLGEYFAGIGEVSDDCMVIGLSARSRISADYHRDLKTAMGQSPPANVASAVRAAKGPRRYFRSAFREIFEGARFDMDLSGSIPMFDGLCLSANPQSTVLTVDKAPDFYMRFHMIVLAFTYFCKSDLPVLECIFVWRELQSDLNELGRCRPEHKKVMAAEFLDGLEYYAWLYDTYVKGPLCLDQGSTSHILCFLRCERLFADSLHRSGFRAIFEPILLSWHQ